VAAWEEQRKDLIARWRTFLGTIEAPRARPALTVLEEDQRDGVVRQLVRYEAEPGLPVEGYLLRPEGTGRGRPGAVVLHSTVPYTIRQPAGLEGTADKHIGLHLARRGYVTFSPRCYLWQYSRSNRLPEAVAWLRKRHPEVTGMAKMLFDAVRAVDILAGQPDVDPKRLGAIGHSLGAKESLYLAAFDPRIRAAVSSEGGVGLGQSNWNAAWYLGEAIRRPGFPLDNAQVLALVAPRAFLLIGGDSADGAASWPYIEAVKPVWALTGAPEAVGLFNHGQGHAFPAVAQERSYAWLDWFLR
jgi:dienelactone hydrolase